MQRPDPNKRKDILRVAEKLFSAKPFHEVKLDAVAEKARIGKGTIYIYFRSKEDLYACLIREGLLGVVEKLSAELQTTHSSTLKQLEKVVRELVRFAVNRPGIFHLMRAVLPKESEAQLMDMRKQLIDIIANVIRRGIERGEVDDPAPELTAQFILSCARGALLFGGKMSADEVTANIMRIFSPALTGRRSAT